MNIEVTITCNLMFSNDLFLTSLNSSACHPVFVRLRKCHCHDNYYYFLAIDLFISQMVRILCKV